MENPGKLVSLQRHIVEEQSLHPSATGEFTRLMWDLTIAVKMISREVNKAGLAEILGATENTNVHNETVMRLDEYAQDRIFKAMDHGGHLCAMASEEAEEIIPIPPQFHKGKYVLVFDPLDGSSNIDANVSVGTIFSIYRKKSTASADGTLEDFLRPGTEQVAAGYVVYGSSTMLVYTTGKGVHGFTLDPSLGEFLLSHENIRTPEHGKYYSINEGNSALYDEPTRRFIDSLKTPGADGKPYSLRYIGSLVADFHRNLLYGGIFLYPAVPKPKLRLLYEGNPLALIIEQAGGVATTGTQRILDIIPKKLHEKVPLIIGSKKEVEKYQSFFAKK